ncbi:MAG: ABC transporter ATP-binding protein [Phycisphaerales bacterium]|nr:MAG: ABC transporter ATP-binding protein [Phycisphaerales bacterium]
MPLLAAHNLHKTYRLGKVSVPVLKGVDIAVETGEFVAILGASGSGKSTLLHLLGGLDRPDKDSRASIEYSGTPLSLMSHARLDHYRRAEVGFVFQFYHLLPELTVMGNVLIAAMIRQGFAGYLARRAEAKAHAAHLLEQVGLAHRLHHRPRELSGGERQRVAIARALVNKPQVLLADEPTGNLDRNTGGTILDMLENLRRDLNLTLVVVTHDATTAARAQRVVELDSGTLRTSKS